MNSTSTANNILKDDPGLRAEYERARRCFRLENRATAAPFMPPTDKRLAESGTIGQIRKNRGAETRTVYIHIPFCESRCHFCDLYCFYVPARHRDIMNAYVDALVREIRLWADILGDTNTAISTVHFGGGSPFYLNPRHITDILNALQTSFPVTEKTELAAELTSSQVTDQTIRFLDDHHITRIHLGVQTLDNGLRRLLGRREKGETVIEKLEWLRSRDRVISADLLYGIPGQTLNSFMEDIRLLANRGSDGFALYELQTTRRFENRMRRDMTFVPPDKISNYEMFLKGRKWLLKAGYGAVFFNHFGNDRDRNLYFTFPVRDEACIALGTIADGVLNNVWFRHHKFKTYLDHVLQGGAGIDFGYPVSRRNPVAARLENGLLATHISGRIIESARSRWGDGFQGMLDLWTSAGLIRQAENGYDFEMTGSGCYLIADMIHQVRRFG